MSVSFNLQRHSDFVQFHGQQFSYYRASLCACGIGPFSRDANRSLINCQTCFGMGIIYASPITLIGLMTGMRNMKDLADFGETFPGDIILGLPPQSSVFINEWDLIRPPFSVGFNGQLVTRGNGSSDTLDYPVSSMFQISSIDFTNNYALVVYTQGTDFTISGRTITWQGSHVPNPGTNYSTNYNAIFDYIVVNALMERYDNISNLGQRALIRKRHLVLPTLAI